MPSSVLARLDVWLAQAEEVLAEQLDYSESKEKSAEPVQLPLFEGDL